MLLPFHRRQPQCRLYVSRVARGPALPLYRTGVGLRESRRRHVLECAPFTTAAGLSKVTSGGTPAVIVLVITVLALFVVRSAATTTGRRPVVVEAVVVVRAPATLTAPAAAAPQRSHTSNVLVPVLLVLVVVAWRGALIPRLEPGPRRERPRRRALIDILAPRTEGRG